MDPDPARRVRLLGVLLRHARCRRLADAGAAVHAAAGHRAADRPAGRCADVPGATSWPGAADRDAARSDHDAPADAGLRAPAAFLHYRWRPRHAGHPNAPPVAGQTPLPPILRDDVIQYLHTHLLLGGHVAIQADPNPTLANIQLTTWAVARRRYGLDPVGEPAASGQVYLAELQGRFTVGGGPYLNPATPSPCGFPAGVLGIYPAEVAVSTHRRGTC